MKNCPACKSYGFIEFDKKAYRCEACDVYDTNEDAQEACDELERRLIEVCKKAMSMLEGDADNTLEVRAILSNIIKESQNG